MSTITLFSINKDTIEHSFFKEVVPKSIQLFGDDNAHAQNWYESFTDWDSLISEVDKELEPDEASVVEEAIVNYKSKKEFAFPNSEAFRNILLKLNCKMAQETVVVWKKNETVFAVKCLDQSDSGRVVFLICLANTLAGQNSLDRINIVLHDKDVPDPTYNGHDMRLAFNEDTDKWKQAAKCKCDCRILFFKHQVNKVTELLKETAIQEADLGKRVDKIFEHLERHKRQEGMRSLWKERMDEYNNVKS